MDIMDLREHLMDCIGEVSAELRRIDRGVQIGCGVPIAYYRSLAAVEGQLAAALAMLSDLNEPRYTTTGEARNG